MSEVVHSPITHQARSYVRILDRRSASLLFAFAWLMLACSGTQTSRPAAPAPMPASPVSRLPAPLSNTGSWSFKYAPGVVIYRISRSAAIETSDPDSVYHREISTNITHELLTLEQADQAIGFTAVVDTFATTTQGRIGPVQSVQLPIQISGLLTDSALTLISDTASEKCKSMSSMLATDLHNLLVAFPKQLSAGAGWKDSADVKGCQGGVPTSTHTTRSYVVSGEVSFEGRRALLVLRADTIHAIGEGGLQQHRVLVDAIGTGTAFYYLDPTTGRIIRLAVDQVLNLGVTTSAKQFRFKQDSKQDFRIVP